MEKQTEDGRRFVMLPSALLYALSDMALRIILYAKHRQGLVDTGRLTKWDLTLTNISDEFKHHGGYGLNTVRVGIRQLRKLNLINLKFDHYKFNADEFEKWYFRDIQDSGGLPNSGRGGLPKSGRAGLPNSGSQKQSSKKKNSSRVEKQFLPSPVAQAQTPASARSLAATFDAIFPEAKLLQSPVKTLDQTFADAFPQSSNKVEAAPDAPDKSPLAVSGILPEPFESAGLTIFQVTSPNDPGNGHRTTPDGCKAKTSIQRQ